MRNAVTVLAIGVACNVFAQAPTVSNTAFLPNLGDSADMSPANERRLGDRIARELYRDPDYIDDAVVQDYVQAIWGPLLVAARVRGDLPAELDNAFTWEILLGKDRTVNAFALPGAYFGLHLGLVGVVSTRDELASVLAHELSHVTQRHISRLLTRQTAQAPWLMGAMILGALAASKSPQAANAMIVGGQAVAAQTQLNFSRDMEREADRIGFGVMTQAGYAPQGFVTMFEKLQQASRLNDSGNYPYLRSHPLTTERIADMQARIPVEQLASTLPEVAEDVASLHAMVSARARVLSNATVDALSAWRQQSAPEALKRQTKVQQVAFLYGGALAALKLRDFAASDERWKQLMLLWGGQLESGRVARQLGAEIALAQGDGVKALKVLGDVPVAASRADVFLRAQAQIVVGKAGIATQSLQTWLADRPKDAQAWQWLSSAYKAQGKTLSSVRAEAEVYAAQLDYSGALARLKAAQELARNGAVTDNFEASIIDTRLRQVDALLREQAVER